MPSGASSQEGDAPSPPRVQDCLWGGDKAHNRRVPVAVHAYSASTEHARQLAAEAAASPYRTVENARLPHAVLMNAGCWGKLPLAGQGFSARAAAQRLWPMPVPTRCGAARSPTAAPQCSLSLQRRTRWPPRLRTPTRGLLPSRPLHVRGMSRARSECGGQCYILVTAAWACRPPCS